MLVVWIPVAVVLGIIVAVGLSDMTGIWQDYIGAVVLPLIGLTGALWLAPWYKRPVCVAVYIIGLSLAYVQFSPSWYPETHPKAYQPTYVPFVMTATVGLAYLAGIWWKFGARSDYERTD